MSGRIDVTELTREIARIASATKDPETGRLLMELIERLLKAAGLPPGSDQASD